MASQPETTIASDSSARERILDTAYDLFARRGIRDVGVDEIVERAGIARATLYRHFKSKDELVLAFLRRREERWTFGSVEAEARRRGKTPEGRLLAIFDVFDEWFQRDDFEACSFVNVLFEMRPTHPLGQASIQHLANIRGMVERLATEAGLADVTEFSRSWHILMKGSIVAATEGDLRAARRAQQMAKTLIANHGGHLPEPDPAAVRDTSSGRAALAATRSGPYDHARAAPAAGRERSGDSGRPGGAD